MFALRSFLVLLVVAAVHGWNRPETVTRHRYTTITLPQSTVTRTKTVTDKYYTDVINTGLVTITETFTNLFTNRETITTTSTGTSNYVVTTTNVQVVVETDTTQLQIVSTWTATSTVFITATKTVEVPLILTHTKIYTTEEIFPVYRTKKFFQIEKSMTTTRIRTTITRNFN
ncbi:unnamed protein product [Meganyctiphanes norvegica]|uniref:Uncharacterized protein n=1 Tax=Meganyctiphanes norvegica TaxID=48144 RepID=A0AAV2RH71_MEGNR